MLNRPENFIIPILTFSSTSKYLQCLIVLPSSTPRTSSCWEEITSAPLSTESTASMMNVSSPFALPFSFILLIFLARIFYIFFSYDKSYQQLRLQAKGGTTSSSGRPSQIASTGKSSESSLPDCLEVLRFQYSWKAWSSIGRKCFVVRSCQPADLPNYCVKCDSLCIEFSYKRKKNA